MFAAQPSFLVTPRDQVVTVGRRVVMRCQVTGNPVPAVFWNKQSSQVWRGSSNITSLGAAVLSVVARGSRGREFDVQPRCSNCPVRCDGVNSQQLR